MSLSPDSTGLGVSDATPDGATCETMGAERPGRMLRSDRASALPDTHYDTGEHA